MTLNGLPVELLERITSYLPLSAAAALTIATRSTFSKLGTKYLWRINQQKRLPYTHWSDVMETPHMSLYNYSEKSSSSCSKETFLGCSTVIIVGTSMR
jgi:hypothetical protein